MVSKHPLINGILHHVQNDNKNLYTLVVWFATGEMSVSQSSSFLKMTSSSSPSSSLLTSKQTILEFAFQFTLALFASLVPIKEATAGAATTNVPLELYMFPSSSRVQLKKVFKVEVFA